jgi:hypothetical protein
MQMKEQNSPSKVPQYWDQLSSADKAGYQTLQNEVSSLITNSGRSQFCKIFEKIVERIKSYIEIGDGQEWRRSLVCGIVWLDQVVALNTRQLITLIGKCKSSINSGFQSMGYHTIAMETEAAVALARLFPFIKGSFAETRQWTLRRNILKSEIIRESEEITREASFSQISIEPASTPNEDAVSFNFVDFAGEDVFPSFPSIPCFLEEDFFCSF